MNNNNDGLFLEPFAKKQKYNMRKRKFENENRSVLSLDISNIQEQSFKRRKRLERVQSIASLLSPVNQVRKVGNALQRSFSGIKISPLSLKFSNSEYTGSMASLAGSSSMINLSSSKSPRNSTKRNAAIENYYKQSYIQPTKRRLSCLWLETLSHSTAKFMKENLTRQELCRQEAIHELYRGEKEILEDLILVKQAYYDSLLHLGILNQDELQRIFGSFHELIPLHEILIRKIESIQQEDGIIENISSIILNWIPGLKIYETYCSNLIRAKDVLDRKKINDKRFEDFLQRCLQSSFSRKLDLWNYLDIPRNRLVKYPLLLQRILKHSSEDSLDRMLLPKAISEIEKVIKTVDECTGQVECQFVLENLYFVRSQQRASFLEESSTVVISGNLKNNRGTKLQAFLFDNGFLLCYDIARHKNLKYEVYEIPIPHDQLVVTDIKNGNIKREGSFRTAFTSNINMENAFRVSFSDESKVYTLKADCKHSKKQWLKKLSSVAVKFLENEKDEDDDGGFLLRPALKQRKKLDLPKDNNINSLSIKREMGNRIKTRSSVANIGLNHTIM